MRVLLALNGFEHPERFVEDLRWAGLPAHTHAIICSQTKATSKQPYVEQLNDHDWPFASTHDEIALASREAERVAHLIAVRFPQWFVEYETDEGVSPLDVARSRYSELVVFESGDLKGASLSAQLEIAVKTRSGIRLVRSAHHQNRPLKLLLCLDGSEASVEAAEAIAHRAFPRNTTLYLLTVANFRNALGEGPFSRIKLNLAQAELAERMRMRPMLHYFERHLQSHFPQIESHVRGGNPAIEILDFVEEYKIDSIFLGANDTRPHGLGDVTRAIIERSHVNVELVRWPVRW